MNRRLLITERFETRMQDPSERGISKNKRDPASATDALQAALAERAQFLQERPHLQAYQNEIDRLLDKSGNHQGRLVVGRGRECVVNVVGIRRLRQIINRADLHRGHSRRDIAVARQHHCA